MQICQYCGTPQEDGIRFCANCGQSLAAPQQPQYQVPPYQQPQYQAPQYQQPQYQAPQYQQPQYQAPQYRPVSAPPQGMLQAAQKAAKIAFLLLICGTIFEIVASLISYLSNGVPIGPTFSSLANALYPCVLIAFLPVLAKCHANNGITRHAKSLQTFAIIYIAAQALSAVATAVMSRFFVGNEVLSVIFYDIAGAGIINSVLYIFRVDIRYIVPNLLWLCADLCFWGVSIFSLIAASKLKKA